MDFCYATSPYIDTKISKKEVMSKYLDDIKEYTNEELDNVINTSNLDLRAVLAIVARLLNICDSYAPITCLWEKTINKTIRFNGLNIPNNERFYEMWKDESKFDSAKSFAEVAIFIDPDYDRVERRLRRVFKNLMEFFGVEHPHELIPRIYRMLDKRDIIICTQCSSQHTSIIKHSLKYGFKEALTGLSSFKYMLPGSLFD